MDRNGRISLPVCFLYHGVAISYAMQRGCVMLRVGHCTPFTHHHTSSLHNKMDTLLYCTRLRIEVTARHVHTVCFSRYCRSVQACQESVLLTQAHRSRYASLHSGLFLPLQKQFCQHSCISSLVPRPSRVQFLIASSSLKNGCSVFAYGERSKTSVPPLVFDGLWYTGLGKRLTLRSPFCWWIIHVPKDYT